MEVPVRTSLLDVLQNNLKTANRNAFLHRYVYIGEYSYNDKNILDLMISIIDTVNDGYCEEPLTGVMLVLPRYFVHFLDGSEDSIVKHFTLLKEKNSEYLGRCKLLVAFHHVNRRMFDNWSFKKEQPPAMLEKIKPTWDYQKTKPYIELCVKKVYSFMVTLRRIDLNKGRMLKGEQKHLKEDLPSVTLLEFLSHSEYLYDFDQFMNIFHTNPVTRSYSGELKTNWASLITYICFFFFFCRMCLANTV